MRRASRLPVVLLLAGACSGTQPPASDADGVLRPCPARPNCVSTSSLEAPSRRMPAVPFTGAPTEAQRRVRDAIRAEPRTRIVAERAGYLRAQSSSRVFGFVDDVELLLDTATRHIHMRSAARVGHGDLGVNHARLQRIRARLQATR